MSEVPSGTTERSEERLVPIPNRRQTSIAVVHPAARAVLLLALAIIWLGALLGHRGKFDRSVFAKIYELGGGHGLHLADIVTRLGTPEILYIVIAVAALWLVLARRVYSAIVLLAICLSCRLLVMAQKVGFALSRPHPSLHHVTVHTYAFPSGHSANSMATFVAIALLFPASSFGRQLAVVVALLIAFAVGISRIILGVHWPTDVVGGWAFGGFWVVAGFWLAEVFRLRTRRSGRAQP